MTFIAILVKEMRLRMRRERTIWILVFYVLLLGLLAWITLNSSFASGSTSINQWSSIGYALYHLLTAIQLLLILFITPAFTTAAINGEKERQTYEMLICSRLSSFSLVTGKLFAGVSSSLLLIAASIPLFSLVFFLGGVPPVAILQDLFTFVITAILVATLGFLCSAMFPRPAVSIVITYMIVLLWLATPIILQDIAPATNNIGYATPIMRPVISYAKNGGVIFIQGLGPQARATQTLPLLTAWNPLMALNDTSFLPFVSPVMVLYTINGVQQGTANYAIAGLTLTPQVAYALLSSIAIVLFFVLSLFFAKPNPLGRLRARLKRTHAANVLPQETLAPIKT